MKSSTVLNLDTKTETSRCFSGFKLCVQFCSDTRSSAIRVPILEYWVILKCICRMLPMTCPNAVERYSVNDIAVLIGIHLRCIFRILPMACPKAVERYSLNNIAVLISIKPPLVLGDFFVPAEPALLQIKDFLETLFPFSFSTLSPSVGIVFAFQVSYASQLTELEAVSLELSTEAVETALKSNENHDRSLFFPINIQLLKYSMCLAGGRNLE